MIQITIYSFDLVEICTGIRKNETMNTVISSPSVSRENRLAEQPSTPIGNPAVVGLAGFGMTTLLLQFHTLGWCNLGPIIAMGFIFGGLAQLVAGFMEQKTGNNFGFSAFVAYGAFWIGLGIIWMLNYYDVYFSSTNDIGFYLLGWTFLTAIYWVGSLYIHKAMTVTFTTLLAGFILLDFGHFGFPAMNTAAGWVLIVCALSAWYMMAAVILNEVSGKSLLKVGSPVLK
jgi:succinate-acetate transporter protein